jgi:hypothetical protein
MEKKIRNYVEQIFDENPKTKKSIELQEELITNLIDKYNDLLEQKKSEEDAYNIVIASIGDISELIGDLYKGDEFNLMNNDNERKRRAKYIAIAVMLYIVSVVPIILMDALWSYSELGVVMMFIIIASATGLIVYVGASKPKYLKENETLVEEFKEWKSKKNKQKVIKSAVLSAFWTLVVAIYLIISFMFHSWAYSWIIFIIAASIEQIIKLVFEIRGE